MACSKYKNWLAEHAAVCLQMGGDGSVGLVEQSSLMSLRVLLLGRSILGKAESGSRGIGNILSWIGGNRRQQCLS